MANVIDVDTINHLIIVKFGGAPSGQYRVVVASATNGVFDTSTITLTTIGTITAISPNTGSIYGG